MSSTYYRPPVSTNTSQSQYVRQNQQWKQPYMYGMPQQGVLVSQPQQLDQMQQQPNTSTSRRVNIWKKSPNPPKMLPKGFSTGSDPNGGAE